jgi:hypothetical protein
MATTQRRSVHPPTGKPSTCDNKSPTLKITDSRPNFRQLDMAELKAIVQDMTKQAGPPKHSDTPLGEDLFIFPSDHAQQEAFLQMTTAVSRSFSASLPKSSIGKKRGHTPGPLFRNRRRHTRRPSPPRRRKSWKIPKTCWRSQRTSHRGMHHIW